MRVLGTLFLIGAIGSGFYFAYKKGLLKIAVLSETDSTTISAPTVLDEAFDVAFGKIKASDLYQKTGVTKRLAIDSVLTTIGSNAQAKQNIKIFSDENNVPLETAITNELLPKK